MSSGEAERTCGNLTVVSAMTGGLRARGGEEGGVSMGWSGQERRGWVDRVGRQAGRPVDGQAQVVEGFRPAAIGRLLVEPEVPSKPSVRTASRAQQRRSHALSLHDKAPPGEHCGRLVYSRAGTLRRACPREFRYK